MVFSMASGKSHHVIPHRAWTYLQADGELSTDEHDHILECESCLHLFLLCLKSESFGAVLKELNKDFDQRRSA